MGVADGDDSDSDDGYNGGALIVMMLVMGVVMFWCVVRVMMLVIMGIMFLCVVRVMMLVITRIMFVMWMMMLLTRVIMFVLRVMLVVRVIIVFHIGDDIGVESDYVCRKVMILVLRVIMFVGR